MANPFDQFDNTPTKALNPFDQFGKSPITASGEGQRGGAVISPDEIKRQQEEQAAIDAEAATVPRLPRGGYRLPLDAYTPGGGVISSPENKRIADEEQAQRFADTEKFLKANTQPGKRIDLEDALPAGVRAVVSFEDDPQKQVESLAAHGINARVATDGNVLAEVPDDAAPGKTKEVLLHPPSFHLSDIAGEAFPLAKTAAITAAGALAAPETGGASLLAPAAAMGLTAAGTNFAGRALARASSGRPIEPLSLTGESIKEGVINAAPVAIAGIPNALLRGAITPIEERGVPALARLTEERVPAEIATGRPALARAANAPLVGNLPSTMRRMDSALAAEQYRMAGEAAPQSQVRSAIDEAINGENGYRANAQRNFAARETPILNAADAAQIKPDLSATTNFYTHEAALRGFQEGGARSTGEEFNKTIGTVRRMQEALQNTQDLHPANLIEVRRDLDQLIDFENLDTRSKALLKGYRDAINDDVHATLDAIPKEQQQAFAKANGGLTPAQAFRANNEEYSKALEPLSGGAFKSALSGNASPESLVGLLRGKAADAESIKGLYGVLEKSSPETAASLRETALRDVLNDVRATPPKNVDASQFNRVDSDAVDKLTGRVGGEIVDKDARAKYAALLGDEGLAFLDDLSDASRLLKKTQSLAEGEKLASPRVLSKELVAGGSGVISQAARLGVDLATAVPRMATGAALRSEAVNRFLASGELPAYLQGIAPVIRTISPALVRSYESETPPGTYPASNTLATRP